MKTMIKRIQLDNDVMAGYGGKLNFFRGGQWPAHWISRADESYHQAGASWYRLNVELVSPLRAQFHISGDERYELYVDGAFAGRGPTRGGQKHWRYETYELDLEKGRHVITARTWWSRPAGGAIGRWGVSPAFLLCADGDAGPLLSTGIAPWETKAAAGLSFVPDKDREIAGPRERLDARVYPWDAQLGGGAGWAPARKGDVAVSGISGWVNTPAFRVLEPTTQPAQAEELARGGRIRHVEAQVGVEALFEANTNLQEEGAQWQALIETGTPVSIPPNTSRRVVIDHETYRCAYPVVSLCGGRNATLRLYWAESFSDPAQRNRWGIGGKGNRSEIYGMNVYATPDEYVADGERRTWISADWACGRYTVVDVQTADEPLTLSGMAWLCTGYPTRQEGSFSCSDAQVVASIAPMLLGLRASSHECFADSPYYERLQYIGDTRLECLVTRAMMRDHRLIRDAIRFFDLSRTPDGFTASRAPTMVGQRIPTFSLLWVLMVEDEWLWGDPAYALTFMGGVRSVLDACSRYLEGDGILGAVPGWNFVDWVQDQQGMSTYSDSGDAHKTWNLGVPPGGHQDPCAPVAWFHVLALETAARLEDACGEPELKARWLRMASRARQAIDTRFWNETRGLYADNLDHSRYSEHAQAIALIAGVDREKTARIATGLLEAGDLARATIYFSHYLFEAFGRLGRGDQILARLQPWTTLPERGLLTTPEQPEPTRSDCHAWGSHPWFHYLATIAGIRPDSPGFGTVAIRPSLGHLEHVEACWPHPCGDLRVNYQKNGKGLLAIVDLPPGLHGWIEHEGIRHALNPGRQQVLFAKDARIS